MARDSQVWLHTCSMRSTIQTPLLPVARLETGQARVTRLESGMAAYLVDQPDPFRVWIGHTE